nr:MAG TPA: hypothetical protein [Caudoviricetes sp.]
MITTNKHNISLFLPQNFPSSRLTLVTVSF